PRFLSLEQDSVPARRHARGGHHRTEQRHQDFFSRGRGADAAYVDRVDLRHEFQAHAGARLDIGLSHCDPADAARSRAAVLRLQMEEVALNREYRRRSFCYPPPVVTPFILQTCWPPLM